MCHVAHVNVPCHKYECIMAHSDGCVLMFSRVTQMNKSCHTHGSVTQMNELCHTYECVMSHSDGHALTPNAAASARERVLRAAQFVSQQRCQQKTVCVAVCCSVFQSIAVCCKRTRAMRCPVCVTTMTPTKNGVCYSVLQCVVVCYSVLQCAVVCCSVVSECCSMLQENARYVLPSSCL